MMESMTTATPRRIVPAHPVYDVRKGDYENVWVLTSNDEVIGAWNLRRDAVRAWFAHVAPVGSSRWIETKDPMAAMVEVDRLDVTGFHGNLHGTRVFVRYADVVKVEAR